MCRPEIGQRGGEGGAKLRVENTDHDAAHQRRIGKRPKHVENRAQPQVGANRRDVTHRRMMARGHQETNPGLIKRAAHRCHLALKIDAKAGENVRRPAL